MTTSIYTASGHYVHVAIYRDGRLVADETMELGSNDFIPAAAFGDLIRAYVPGESVSYFFAKGAAAGFPENEDGIPAGTFSVII